MREDQLNRLLRDYARSFALTLRFLPRALREPLRLGYLLARASDTVADAVEIPREQRLKWLVKLQRILDSREALHLEPGFAAWEMDVSERGLIKVMPMLFIMLQQSADRAGLQKLWRTILKGQIFDLQRFRDNSPPLSHVELEEYCYLVAGSVGEAWTELISIHSPQTFLAPKEELKKMGVCYGKGLQLLNILRDQAADRELGRSYLRAEDVPVMMDLAAAWLGEGNDYCSALAPGRIRYATELPLRLAQKTLTVMRKRSSAVPVKISRATVYGVLLQTLPSLVLRSSWNPAS